MIHASEAWDFSWMAAAVQSLETYEAALETAEMIAFPIDLELPPDTVTTLHSTRDWAIQTLLDIQVAQLRDLNGDDLQPPTMSKSLQQMQNKLFVSAPCRQADVQMELHQSLLAAVQSEEEKDTVSDVLEMCATSLENDKQFLQFSEAALTGKSEELVFGSAFPQRLFDRRSVQLEADEGRMRRGRRLFDALTLESKVPVWANHLPSWHSQLQAWMLEAHRAPFQPISAVLPDASATTDVLESVEYIFRRFTPPRAKRPFQVELVAQLLVELEWRATNHNMKTRDTGRFLDGIAPLCAWLTKIVRLMQLEEQTAQQKDSRHRYSNRRSPANDVEYLTERLEKFSR
ncbi:hypothetical protein JG688_00003390 [Phytophthora aleatoria]|uniref:Uncharacterized protein n=1 Tax=Phytophthora aleatoria TaxID=2496075 RepID=A0A8J5J4M6_9STRA|nr:hypothetical protein JG688_00003390 [Phytophthora aleatoria]